MEDPLARNLVMLIISYRGVFRQKTTAEVEIKGINNNNNNIDSSFIQRLMKWFID